MQPGWVVDTRTKEWVLVVQTETIQQVLTVAKCLYRDRACEYIPPCYRYGQYIQHSYLYRSYCIQDYSSSHVITVAAGAAPQISRVTTPSGCRCWVKDFVFY